MGGLSCAPMRLVCSVGFGNHAGGGQVLSLTIVCLDVRGQPISGKKGRWESGEGGEASGQEKVWW